MNLQKDKDGFWLLDGQRLVVQTTVDEDGLNATGANISEERFQELLEENSIVRAHNQLGEVIQVQLDMDRQSLVVVRDEEVRSEIVRICADDLTRWLETAQRHPNILLGTRMIVLDKHERVMSRNHDTESGSFAFVAPDAELLGVTFLSPAQAMSVVAELERKWPENGPFEAKDLQAFALAEVEKVSKVLTSLQTIETNDSRAPEPSLNNHKQLYVRLLIESIGNAAFVDTGRHEEISRIIADAAQRLDESPPGTLLGRHALFDINGNRVGGWAVQELALDDNISDGGVSLFFKADGAAFQDDPAGEISRMLREAAEKVNAGKDHFKILDRNGNWVGNYSYQAPALEIDGVINMKTALAEGRVYLAEDSFSGIADGASRFVVTTSEFEPGYGQGAGRAYLVNAKGEIAGKPVEHVDGNGDVVLMYLPEYIQENTFDKMSREQLAALQDVVEGHVSFEDYERTFDNDPELG